MNSVPFMFKRVFSSNSLLNTYEESEEKKAFSSWSYSEVLYLHRLHVFSLLKFYGDLSCHSISTGTLAIHTVLNSL